MGFGGLVSSDSELVIKKQIDFGSGSGELTPFLDEVQEEIGHLGLTPEKEFAVRDILLEYLSNAALHRAGCPSEAERQYIEVRKEGGGVAVSMHGSGRLEDVARIQRIVDELSKLDRQQLWTEWRKRAFGAKPFETPGAGMGLLTIAALSERKQLMFKADMESRFPSFTLTSGV